MTKTEFFTAFILARAGVLGKNQCDSFDICYDAEELWKKLKKQKTEERARLQKISDETVAELDKPGDNDDDIPF